MKVKSLWFSILFLMLIGGCHVKPHTSKRATDSKGLMTANQNLTIYETSHLSSVDISKVASFAKLGSSTEGLFRMGKNGHLKLGQAASYKVSNNGKRYVFKLRPNARWSNGEAITANDFVYSWQRTVNPAIRSVNAAVFDGIKNARLIRTGKLAPSTLGVKATSKRQLEVTLEHPMFYFTRLLAYPLFAPQHQGIVETYGREYGKKADRQLYSGPYKLVSWHSNSLKRKLVPNPYYWDRAHVYLHSLTIATAKSAADNLKQYDAGKTDEIQLIGNQIPQNKNRPDYNVRPFALTRFTAFNFNTPNRTNRKLINDLDARMAVTHAIDRPALITSALKNASLPPTGFIPAGLGKNNLTNSDFADDQVFPNNVKKNRPRAKQEWQKALQKAGRKDYEFTLSVPNDPVSVRVAENLKHQLTQTLAGLKIKIKPYFTENNANQQLKGNYDLLLTGWGAEYPDPLAFFAIMTQTSRYNFGHWKNREYDALIDQITEYETDDPEVRWQQMLKAEALLMQDQPIVPLYQQATSYLTNPRLNGVVYNVTGVAADYKSAYLVK